MPSQLRVDSILPSVGTDIGIGTAGGSVTLTGAVSGANLNFTGITTLSGITTVTGETLFTRQLSVSGVTTTSSLSINGTVSPSPNGSINITGVADTTQYTPTGTSNGYPDAYKALYLRNNSVSDGAGCLMLMSANNSGGFYNWWYLGSIATADANRAGNFVIGSRNSGANYSERLRINSSGNVGVGSTQPASKLDVVDSGASGSVVRSRVTTNNGGYLAYEALNSSGTSVFSVTHNGRINLSENIVFASGQGLDFSATANSSGTMSSELLSDYEEGTWTPVLQFGGGTTGITYNASYTGGTYTKIGNRVFITGSLELTNKGSSTGTATITGLPFAIATLIYSPVLIKLSSVTYTGQYGAECLINQTTFQLNYVSEAGAQTNILNTNFTNASYVSFMANYRTTA